MAIVAASAFVLPLSSAPIPTSTFGAFVPLPLSTSITTVILLGVSPAPGSVDPSVSTGSIVEVLGGLVPNSFEYAGGYRDGERYGFSSIHEETAEQIDLDETDNDKKTIDFHIYTKQGLPASGVAGEGAVCSPIGSQIQTKRDLGAYANALGTFSHISDAKYRYTFSASEVAATGGEGNIWLRVKVPDFRVAELRTPIRLRFPTTAEISAAILNAARSGFIGTGTIGEGVAIGMAMLQGNILMDKVHQGPNGQTFARVRCFHSGSAASAATQGGSGEGEFATFIVTTSYTDTNQIASHRVVQQ